MLGIYDIARHLFKLLVLIKSFMNKYILDQEFSTKELISLIFKEEIEHQKLSEEISSLQMHFEFLRNDFLSSQSSEDINDVGIQYRFIKMAQKNEEVEKTQAKIARLKDSLDNKGHSIDALSMSLLQIAKQGISKVYGKPQNCPDGRDIGRETLKNVIWQGRNQSIHYEEANPNAAVLDCFSNLAITFGNNFDLSQNPATNCAKIVVNLLDWKSYENYQRDMKSLLG